MTRSQINHNHQMMHVPYDLSYENFHSQTVQRSSSRFRAQNQYSTIHVGFQNSIIHDPMQFQHWQSHKHVNNITIKSHSIWCKSSNELDGKMYMIYSTDLIFKRNASDRKTHDVMSIVTHDVNDTTRERKQIDTNQPHMAITPTTRTFRDSIRIILCSKHWLHAHNILQSPSKLHFFLWFTWKVCLKVTPRGDTLTVKRIYHFSVLRTFREHYRHSNLWKINTLMTLTHIAEVPGIEEIVLSASK